jgi:outer membrane autotransporter protein
MKGVFIDGVVGAGWMTFDSRRFVSAAGDYASGDRNGQQIFGSMTAGYEYTNGGLLLSPYARVNLSYSALDQFTETGAGLFALRYGEQSVNTLTSFLGLRAEYKLPVSWGVVTPRARIEYGHDFDASSLATLAYTDWIGGPEYVLEIDPADRDFLVLGLGADIAFDGSWTLGVDYRTAFGQGSDQQHLLQIKAGNKF